MRGAHWSYGEDVSFWIQRSTVRTPAASVCCVLEKRYFFRIASVDSGVKLVPGGDNLVKGVQCYELFGGNST